MYFPGRSMTTFLGEKSSKINQDGDQLGHFAT